MDKASSVLMTGTEEKQRSQASLCLESYGKA